MKTNRLLLITLLMLIGNFTYATHIRGGEITYKRVSAASLTYEFQLTMYHDIQSPVRSGDGIISFGDGREVQIDLEADSFEDNIFIGHHGEFELFKITITHTYAAPGTYPVNYREPNRNDEIVNINLGNPIQIPFSIKSMVVVDPEVGINSSPVFNTFPIDFGFVGKTFTHNPWAQDPDGDSLSYRLVTPEMDLDQAVTYYLTPNNQEFYDQPLEWNQANEAGNEPAQYKIDPLTGDLNWDAPGNLLKNSQGDFSQYNLALAVEEWRQINGSWRKIGFITRDFLVDVTPEAIGRPDFELPDDRIINVSESINENIVFSDPDGDPIKVEFFGDVFDLPNSPMTIYPTPVDFTTGPLSLDFEWTPLPEHSRRRPYYVHMKITDAPTNSTNPSVTYKTWILSSDVIPDVITGLPGAQEFTNIKVYPNPTSGKLQWLTAAFVEPGYLAVYNLLGQRTISAELTSYGVKEIDVSSLASGAYLLQLTDRKKKYQARFFKK